jgi:MoaA/NifB/PqqE/SkfB family radical SAM enzyme
MAGNTSEKKAVLKPIVIETTRRCNLKCIHCKVSPENNEGNYEAIEMPVSLFDRLIPVLRTYRPLSS